LSDLLSVLSDGLWFLCVYLIWVCGILMVVQLSMHDKNRNRGLAFVTMGSPEEALTALNKLESYVSILGFIIFLI
jgi:hypothetical protein